MRKSILSKYYPRFEVKKLPDIKVIHSNENWKLQDNSIGASQSRISREKHNKYVGESV